MIRWATELIDSGAAASAWAWPWASHGASKVLTHVPLFTLALLAISGLPALASDAEPSAERLSAELVREDFATGRIVEIPRTRSLQTLLLDAQVYRGSIEDRLADLRVFNREGEPIPHAIRTLASPTTVETEIVRLPVFSLPSPGRVGRSDERSDIQALARQGIALYSIDAEISSAGAIVRVRPLPAAPDDPEAASPPDSKPSRPTPSGYLLDASQVNRAIISLDLELPEERASDGFIVNVMVEGSHDLTHFFNLEAKTAIVRLEQDGHQIEQSRIDLALGGAGRHRDTRRRTQYGYKYLRLSFPSDPLPVPILAVRAGLAPVETPPKRQEVRIEGSALAPRDGQERAFLFDLGGEIPVDRVQVDLPNADSLMEAELFSGPTAEGPWGRHFSGLLYELEHPKSLRNPEIVWPRTYDRFFKLVVAAKGGGLGSGVPVLEASWYPEQLLFVTRGRPPFTLAYGRYGAASTRFDADELLATTKSKPAAVPRESAQLGREFELAGSRALEAPEQPLPLRKLALWAVLVLIVLAIAGMCVRLLREMRSTPE